MAAFWFMLVAIKKVIQFKLLTTDCYYSRFVQISSDCK